MPVATMASAISRINDSLTSQPNLFHEFQPMGGVGARPSSLAASVIGTTRSSTTMVRPAAAMIGLMLLKATFRSGNEPESEYDYQARP